VGQIRAKNGLSTLTGADDVTFGNLAFVSAKIQPP
jgi:hypothetical protein